jgi:CHASE2 domain-containing sensor protein
VNQYIVLKFSGSFKQGFVVTLQIGEDGRLPTIEVMGNLPPNSDLQQSCQAWRSCYRQLGSNFRLSAPQVQTTNVAHRVDCQTAAQSLVDGLNIWLRQDSFRPIREKWLEQLHPAQPLRILLQTDDPDLKRMPWHQWEVIDRYHQAEIALSLPNYERVSSQPSVPDKVRILAILGNSAGIDVEADRQQLEQLPDAEVCFLVEPLRQELSDRLWAQAWDILFFAGHSFSSEGTNPEDTNPEDTNPEGTNPENSHTGVLAINSTESLTIDELRYGLRKAIDRGLQFAIFNSCDGLGLARNLADLQIPQMIVMREPVPDRVAQTFLKSFLSAFSQASTFYQSVREAREQLQGLENSFPCATWLPIICQNPAVVPPSWRTLQGDTVLGATVLEQERSPQPVAPVSPNFKPRRFAAVLLISFAVTACSAALRYVGALQPVELWAFDQMIRSRPSEPIDSRLLIVAITEAEIQTQKGQRSLSDTTLNQLLARLELAKPQVIGLDLYRDFPVQPNQARLIDRLKQTQELIVVCKSSDPENNIAGIAPPPEVSIDRVGFSDFWEDQDGILRRQALFVTPDPASPCTTPYAFNSQIAFRYLNARGITPSFTSDGNLRLGNTIFPRLMAHAGGYQGIKAQGNQILINYRPKAATEVTLSQVLSGQVKPESIRDRIVLIGVIAESSADVWLTPYGTNPSQRMAGVLVQSQMISQILSATIDRRPLIWVWSWAGDVVWIGVWSMVGSLSAVWFHRGSSRLIAIVISAIVLCGICFAVFCLQAGWLPLVPALLVIVATHGVVIYYVASQQP